jgi:hypothetical protein
VATAAASLGAASRVGSLSMKLVADTHAFYAEASLHRYFILRAGRNELLRAAFGIEDVRADYGDE